MIGKIYQTEIVFNRNSSLDAIDWYGDRVLFMSGTWSKWIIDSCYYSKPLGLSIKDEKMKIDIFKLVLLISSFSYDDVNDGILADRKQFAAKTKLSERFSRSSNFRRQSERLKI